MKKRCQVLILSVLTLILIASLCACEDYQKAVNQQKIIGTWLGSGDLDYPGPEEAPFEFAQQWTFTKDGTAVATVNSENVEFTYCMSDDAITLSMDGSETSWGISYQIEGDTLSINLGPSGYAEFARVK